MSYEFTATETGAVYSNLPISFSATRYDTRDHKPGLWTVARWISPSVIDWQWRSAFQVEYAVMDDFGNLVRVQ